MRLFQPPDFWLFFQLVNLKSKSNIITITIPTYNFLNSTPHFFVVGIGVGGVRRWPLRCTKRDEKFSFFAELGVRGTLYSVFFGVVRGAF